MNDAADTEYFAGKVKDNGGVYVVPAFTGDLELLIGICMQEELY